MFQGWRVGLQIRLAWFDSTGVRYLRLEADMDGIAKQLRERSLRAEQEGEPLALLDEAADEIERLRSLTQFQDGVIRSGDVACLTGAEREAIEHAISRELDAEHYGGDEPTRVVVLRGLLDRLGGEQ